MIDDNMKIEKWIKYEEAEGKEENGLGGSGGWFGYDEMNRDAAGRWTMSRGRWPDYLDHFEPKVRSMLEELYQSIVANRIRCTGEEHQHGAVAVPLWDNGKVDTYSMRAWGDLMAAVWSTEDNKDYGYMDFYA